MRAFANCRHARPQLARGIRHRADHSHSGCEILFDHRRGHRSGDRDDQLLRCDVRTDFANNFFDHLRLYRNHDNVGVAGGFDVVSADFYL